MDQFDYIIIGSTPICIIEAIYRKIQGSSVIILEKSDKLGGAWSVTDFANISDVESGCHILDMVHDGGEALMILQRYLGINLEKFNPQPIRIINGNIRPYNSPYFYTRHLKKHLKILIISSLSQIKSLLLFFTNKIDISSFEYRFRSNLSEISNQFTAIWNVLKNICNWLRINRGYHFYYFQGGVPNLLNQIKEKLVEFSVPVSYNTTCDELKVFDDRVDVVTNQEVFRSKKVILTSGTNIRTVKGLSNEIKLEIKSQRYVHLHMLVEDSTPSSFTYIHDMDHDIVTRISDVTRYATDPTDGHRKILVASLHLIDEFNDSIPENILSYIASKGLLAKKFKLIAHKFTDLTVFHRPFNNAMEISKYSNHRIITLRSTNFIKSIAGNAKRWGAMIDRLKSPAIQ